MGCLPFTSYLKCPALLFEYLPLTAACVLNAGQGFSFVCSFFFFFLLDICFYATVLFASVPLFY